LRTINAALMVWSERMTKCGGVHKVIILWIDAYFAYRLSILQADEFPCLACILGFVNTFPGHRVSTYASFSRPRVNHVRIRLSHSERADDANLEIFVRHIAPGITAVLRLPDAASGRAEIKCIGLIFMPHDRDRPPGA